MAAKGGDGLSFPFLGCILFFIFTFLYYSFFFINFDFQMFVYKKF